MFDVCAEMLCPALAPLGQLHGFQQCLREVPGHASGSRLLRGDATLSSAAQIVSYRAFISASDKGQELRQAVDVCAEMPR